MAALEMGMMAALVGHALSFEGGGGGVAVMYETLWKLIWGEYAWQIPGAIQGSCRLNPCKMQRRAWVSHIFQGMQGIGFRSKYCLGFRSRYYLGHCACKGKDGHPMGAMQGTPLDSLIRPAAQHQLPLLGQLVQAMQVAARSLGPQKQPRFPPAALEVFQLLEAFQTCHRLSHSQK